MKPTKQQARRIYQLCGWDKEEKAGLVARFTGDSTKTSCYDLTHAQANELIVHLGGVPIGKKCWGTFDHKKRGHRYVLSLLRQLGWTTINSADRVVADIEKLGEWLQGRKAPVRKPLLGMTSEEVNKTISALEIMVKKQYA